MATRFRHPDLVSIELRPWALILQALQIVLIVGLKLTESKWSRTIPIYQYYRQWPNVSLSNEHTLIPLALFLLFRVIPEGRNEATKRITPSLQISNFSIKIHYLLIFLFLHNFWPERCTYINIKYPILATQAVFSFSHWCRWDDL